MNAPYTKQTTANNKTLQAVAKMFKAHIYEQAENIYNGRGADAMYKYLQIFHRSDIDVKLMIELAEQKL